ncbi:MAG TPA: ZIP family metal transporter [Bacteroidota bacterium]|nr:ZIP family metal transporter [Bacteroidota bacterium]
MSLTILLYGFLAGGAAVLGGMFVVLRKEWPAKVQEYLLALSAGFLLSLVFIELFPESLHAVGPEAPLYMLAGYAVLHFFEHTLVGHLHFGEETHTEIMVSRVASYSTFVGLCIHAFFDGFTIAVGMQFNFAVGLLIFIAVILHKIPEGLTIASVMIAARQSRSTALTASIIVGVATFLGAAGALLLGGISEEMVGIAFAFSAGVATYVGASDLIPEINHAKNRVIPLLVFVGMLLFYMGKLGLETFAGIQH